MVVRISKNRVALENIPLNEAIGANIASAGTINLTTATGNTVHLTGTTTITAVTLGAGMIRDVIFDGILTLTHHATNNNLPGGGNITTAVNDRARYIADGTTVYCVSYQKADGTALLPASASVAAHATTSDLFTAKETVLTGAAVTFTGTVNAPFVGAEARVYMNAAHTWTDGGVFDVQGNGNRTVKVGDWVRINAVTLSTFDVLFDNEDGTAVASSGYPYLLYQEQQTAGTDGGTFTSGAWRTRALNTEVADTGNYGSVASSQITLAAGTYKCKAWASAYGCNNHATRLYNITDSTEILVGASGRSWFSGSDGTQDKSVITGRFTLAAQKIIELQHQCQTTRATYGLGTASQFGVTYEIFCEVELWRE